MAPLSKLWRLWQAARAAALRADIDGESRGAALGLKLGSIVAILFKKRTHLRALLGNQSVMS